MDTHPDDLTDLERRLTVWQPDREALDADAMLFAAGRAVGRRGARLWPVLTGLLAMVVIALGAWGLSERAERLRLAEQRSPLPTPAPTVPTPAVEYVGSASLLAVHRALERGQQDWSPPPPATEEPAMPTAPPEVLRLGQRDALLAW